MISICMTFKNRASFMEDKLKNLLEMNYDHKNNLEICVTDGWSTDEGIQILQDYASKFLRIKYAISDRSALPFKIPSNNPACDINAQICHQPTFDKIIRTDVEVLFTHVDTLGYVDRALDNHRNADLQFLCRKAPKGWNNNPDRLNEKYNRYAFFTSAFRRSEFIKNGGVHEDYVKGFGGEDSYFHWWWQKNSLLIFAPVEYYVVHLWHEGTWTKENKELRNTYTLPLHARMKRGNIKPNSDNVEWMRAEMLKETKIWT